MKKLKLKTHKRKNKFNKSSKKMMKGSSNSIRSTRSNRKPMIDTLEINGQSNTAVRKEYLINFINNNISLDEPVIVSLPVPPERHAFLVHIKSDTNEILISDWGGEENKNRDKNNPNHPWSNYCNFLRLLKKKYSEYNIVYYPVDEEIEKEADEHHKCNSSSGGCSYYIYKWVEKHYPDYKV